MSAKGSVVRKWGMDDIYFFDANNVPTLPFYHCNILRRELSLYKNDKAEMGLADPILSMH